MRTTRKRRSGVKNMMKNKGYSVLMSVYHKEKPEFFRTSIQSMLEQSVMPSDFVIVCDGPLGEGLEAVIRQVCGEYPDLFQIVRIPVCGGLGKALNEGLRHCRQEVIARMDSDDISVPTRCQLQLEAMERERADIVSGTLYEFEQDPGKPGKARKLPQSHEEILQFARRRNPFNHPCVMYRKSAVMTAGGYRHCPYFEDYDLWARMLLGGSRGYNLQEPLLYMRAGKDMYARRGGFAYARLALKFRWSLKKRGLSGWSDFLVSGVGQFLISIAPNQLRRNLYGKLLRKEV